MSAAAPMLEVVICTWNNAASLEGVLVALARQESVEQSRWSCLVVDNNCADDTQDVIQRFVAAGTIPGLRSVHEPEQGLTPARLRGARSSTAAWIAFVDDDCFVRPDWIAQAIAFAERHPAIGAFGGKVVLDWDVEPPRWLRNYGWLFAANDQGDVQREVAFVAGAGLVVSRRSLAASGWISAPLLADRVGESLVSGGDVEIVLRIRGAGYALWYVPECELRHRIPARRMAQRYLRSISFNLGISQALSDVLVWEGSASSWRIASTVNVLQQILRFLGLAFDAVRRVRSVDEISVQRHFTAGQLVGIWRIVGMAPRRRRELLGRAARQKLGAS